MTFQVHQDTILWGGDIQRRHAARPQEAMCPDRIFCKYYELPEKFLP